MIKFNSQNGAILPQKYIWAGQVFESTVWIAPVLHKNAAINLPSNVRPVPTYIVIVVERQGYAHCLVAALIWVIKGKYP